ncbi:hypothetical protein RAN3_2205 [plant metagenome]|uniref:WG repeat-containing protein n=1 Tax=plant metagenome TaxID=1297885 RepID=A0A484TYJ7_9ZZZZ
MTSTAAALPALGPTLLRWMLGAALATSASAAFAQSAEDGLQDAVGVVEEDGSVTAYSDPFCAGFAESFKKNGGDRSLMPECPEEPVEPMSMSPHAKGERAGLASALAYVDFRKHQKANGKDLPLLPGFYDKSQDAWIMREDGYYPFTSFDGDPYAVISKEDVGMGVIDRLGHILVPIEYGQIGFESTRQVISVRDRKSEKAGLYSIQGEQLVKPRYDAAELIDGKHLLTLRDGVYEVLDLKGKALLSTRKPISPAGEDRFWFMEAPQRHGIMDAKGKVIVQPEFTYTSGFQDGKLVSQKEGGENYVIYRDGKVVKQP